MTNVATPTIATSSFQSVKLPTWLVTETKEQAKLFRRSTAAQIEYWVELGRQYERSGVTIEQVEEVLKREDALRVKTTDHMDKTPS